VRAADVGLTFITVAAGLVVETTELHAAAHPFELATVAQGSGPSPRAELLAAGQGGPVAIVADRPAPLRSTVTEHLHVETVPLHGRATGHAHRPRGPPVR
jgi:hypothetical protein